MKKLSVIFSTLALVLSASLAHSEEFPSAPSKLKEAEAQGLKRATLEELKAFIPGTIISKGVAGKHTKTFNPDGTVHRTGFGDKEDTGKWRFDEKNNTYCNGFIEKKGYEETCFVVLRATDGKHFFDYDIDTGFYSHVWRRKQVK
jgi:hypothetical protein